MSRPAPKPRRKRPVKPPTTPAGREAAFRALLREAAEQAPTAKARQFFTLLAKGEYGEGTNRPEPQPNTTTPEKPAEGCAIEANGRRPSRPSAR